MQKKFLHSSISGVGFMSSVWESVANTTNRVLMLWQFFLMINRI